MEKRFFVYMLQCKDDTFYIGYTTDLERRVEEHNTSPKGAKYTRGRRPVKLAYHVACDTRSDAMKKEAQLKRLSRLQKEMLVDRLDSTLESEEDL